jgi:hypothetical protein
MDLQTTIQEADTADLVIQLYSMELVESVDYDDDKFTVEFENGARITIPRSNMKVEDALAQLDQMSYLAEEALPNLAVIAPDSVLKENAVVDKIKKIAKTLKVGDKTTYGVITQVGDGWIEFKAKDTPKTKIKLDQRAGGRDNYVLKHLALAESAVEVPYTPSFGGRKDPLVETTRALLSQIKGK